MNESQILSTCLFYLNTLEKQGKIFSFRSQAGAVKVKHKNGVDSYMRLAKSGAPDITVCVNGQFIGIEVKAIKGKQSPNQKIIEDKIIKAGGKYHIVRSVMDLKQIIESYV